jgi:hypothetical protein
MQAWLEVWSWREMLAGCGVLVGLLGNGIYINGILRGKVKPHLFTYLVWGLALGIAATAQSAKGAGVGNWVTIFNSLYCLTVALLALKYGEKNLTRSDWVCFILALAGIPLWYFTGNPLWSVVCVSAIDVLAYIPTFRKSWHKPQQEAVVAYILGNVRTVCGLIALENYNLTTMLYSVVIVIADMTFVCWVLGRRWYIKRRADAIAEASRGD